IEKCAATRAPLQVERRTLARYGASAVAVMLVALAIFGVGPKYLRQALTALLSVTSDVEAAAPYRIDVSPGNATIPKGADQSIAATLKGYTTSEALLYVRKGGEQQFDRMPLIPNDKGGLDVMLFAVSAQTEYYVQAEGVQSQHYTLKVVDLPYVQQLKLEY